MMSPVDMTGEAAPALLNDVRQLIEQARARVASAASSVLTVLYWQVGQKISSNLLTDGRAVYGREILPTLSAKLVPAYGKGFSERNLARMPDVQVLQAQLHRVVQLARERQARQALDAANSLPDNKEQT